MKNRLAPLMQSLKPRECMVIENPVNRRYFTAFQSSAGQLFVTNNEAVFYTDSRYITAAQSEIDRFITVKEKKTGERMDGIIKKLSANTALLEAGFLTYTQAKNLQKQLGNHSIAVRLDGEMDTFIAHLRSIKKEDEVENILKAQRIAERAFEHILEYIKAGKTEREIALELDFTMLKQGAERTAFDTIVASGKNSAKPHAVPSAKTVQNGEFITMDFGCVVNGYHSDMTRTVAAGNVSGEMRKVYAVVLNAQEKCLRNIQAGMSGQKADALARNVITLAGYGSNFGHGTGHSLGLEIHETPALTPTNTKKLLENQVVTVEPGIYIAGEFGVRIEDMVLLSNTGARNLTKARKELIVL